MKICGCVRINSQRMEKNAVYHFVKDGIGGISLLKNGERMGFVDGFAFGCETAEVLNSSFKLYCRVMPLVGMGSFAVFRTMSWMEILSASIRRRLLFDKPAELRRNPAIYDHAKGADFGASDLKRRRSALSENLYSTNKNTCLQGYFCDTDKG